MRRYAGGCAETDASGSVSRPAGESPQPRGTRPRAWAPSIEPGLTGIHPKGATGAVGWLPLVTRDGRCSRSRGCRAGVRPTAHYGARPWSSRRVLRVAPTEGQAHVESRRASPASRQPSEVGQLLRVSNRPRRAGALDQAASPDASPEADLRDHHGDVICTQIPFDHALVAGAVEPPRG